MSAREIIENELEDWVNHCLSSVERADKIISALTAAGCRIVGPGEVDGETLEAALGVVAAEHQKCRQSAEEAEAKGDKASMLEHMGHGGTCVLVYAAIRALAGKEER